MLFRSKGKQSHGAFPQFSIDPVVMASQAVMALQTIRSRNLSTFEPAVVSVTQLIGGVRNNIIPAEVRMVGTARAFSNDTLEQIQTRMREILDGTTKAAGGSFTLSFEGYGPVNKNDDKLTVRSVPLLEKTLGKENVRQTEPLMAAEIGRAHV